MKTIREELIFSPKKGGSNEKLLHSELMNVDNPKLLEYHAGDMSNGELNNSNGNTNNTLTNGL